jgi:hypothetical protein
VDINNLHRRNNYHCLKGDIRPDLMTRGGGQEMTEDIASRDYEAEIYLLKAEIKRLGEFEDYYIRTHKHVYVAAIVQPYEEKIKVLEAEVEGLKCCGNCVHHYRPDLAPKCEAMFDFCYCDNWTPDGLTRERRKYGLADE